jgi:hypothetical protein
LATAIVFDHAGGTASARVNRDEVIGAATNDSVVEIPVHFDVVNSNTSALPCASDGQKYTVHGHLVGPRSEFVAGSARSEVVTILLTGWDEGEWTWRFTSVPGYDYPREMAELGHTSLSIDMLGYGRSGHPNGHVLCWGSQADVLHQIIGQLRAGSYSGEMRGAPRFSTILTSGHDVGPWPAIIAAYSWPGEIDGIASQILAHQGFTPYILDIFARRNAGCGLGGQQHDDERDDADDLTDDPSHGGGYVYFGPRDEQFRTDLFYEKRAETDVIDAVIALRNRNACGQVYSSAPTVRMNLSRMGEIDVPVLLVFPGPDDPVISRDGQEQEAANYSGSDDVTTAWMDSGHFMELEECAPDFRALYANWVHERWRIGKTIAARAVGPEECVTEVRASS